MATVQDCRRSNIQYAAVTVDISGVVTDLSLRDTTALFDKVEVARELVLRNTEAVAVKLNSVDNDSIDLFKNEGINMSGIPVADVYVTTSSKGAKVRIWITGWN